MTKLLEKAFEEASKLPEVEQNILARRVLQELESEKQWENAFAASEDVLETMADDALMQHTQGKTSRLDVNKL